jgi:mono/diheme cytochrome c family protein
MTRDLRKRSASPYVFLALATLALTGCATEAPAPAPEPESQADPRVMASSAAEAGRYLAIVGGCNDCHTAGYLQTNGQVPEEEWFTGSIVGFRGPWGTTYPSNLRLRASEMDEDTWVDVIHLRTDLPPMPWVNVNQMSEADARALYQYLVSLGPKGEHMPVPVPPGEEPATPWISLEPENMEAMPDGPAS